MVTVCTPWYIHTTQGGRHLILNGHTTKGFFQQPIEVADRWKTALITPNQDDEQVKMAFMGWHSSSGVFFGELYSSTSMLKPHFVSIVDLSIGKGWMMTLMMRDGWSF